MNVKIRIFKDVVFSIDYGYQPKSTDDFFDKNEIFDKESLVKLVNKFKQTVNTNDCHLIEFNEEISIGGYYELELNSDNKPIASIEII